MNKLIDPVKKLEFEEDIVRNWRHFSHHWDYYLIKIENRETLVSERIQVASHYFDVLKFTLI